jgi:hypothetical protein
VSQFLYDSGTYKEESGQEDQRNTSNVDSDIDLVETSINDGFLERWLDSYRVMVVRTILEEIVSKNS